MKKKMWKKILCGVVSAVMVMSAATVSSFAYIERGDVTISGEESYTLQEGETAELNVSPYAEEHYPGCQMPECPEICGEKDCIEYVNGQPECTCNGRELTLYEAEVTLESSDESVAEASYDKSSGTVTITAVSAGEAVISVEAAMREYNSASREITVTVEGEPEEGGSGSGGSVDPDDSGSGSSGDSGGSGGSGGSSVIQEYTVTFETGDGSAVEKQTVESGDSVSRPEDPEMEGFVFGGWYADSDLTVPYDFGSKVTESITLYAKWTEEQEEPDPVTEISFSDVASDAWYAEYVMKLAEKNIVSGKSENIFAPEDFVTRAEFVKIIAGVAGTDVGSMAASGISFSDVASDAWYAPYVTWAAQNGIVMGSGDKFSPDSKITREDMAVIIDRYVEKLASRQLEKVNEPKDFTDSSEISDYAAEAVSVMQQAGILSGKGADNFAPKDNATRAEACKMIAMVMDQTSETA